MHQGGDGLVRRLRGHGEKDCHDAGKLRQEGKNYVVQDGDVMRWDST
ncbi:MAG: DUF933 domain-containing protein [Eggerthellaceae bacterium]